MDFTALVDTLLNSGVLGVTTIALGWAYYKKDRAKAKLHYLKDEQIAQLNKDKNDEIARLYEEIARLYKEKETMAEKSFTIVHRVTDFLDKNGGKND